MADGPSITGMIIATAGLASVAGIGVSQLVNVFILGGRFAQKADKKDLDDLRRTQELERLAFAKDVATISANVTHLISEQAAIREDVRVIRNGSGRDQRGN